jgi:hypothetical protein
MIDPTTGIADARRGVAEAYYYGWPGIANISLFNFYSLPQHTLSL